MTPTWVAADIGQYRGGEWTAPRHTNAIDSDQLCRVDGCTRAAGDSFVCPTCTDRLEQALGDVPALLEDLLVMVTRQDRMAPATGRKATKARGTRWRPRRVPRHLPPA